jgi:hypothetical protein
MSRIHASFVDSSTTRIDGDSVERQCSYCASETAIVTGSLSWIASATAANAACAGFALRRQLSGRSGHAIQQPACGSCSPGILKPSAAGVEVSVALIGQAKHVLALDIGGCS